MRLSDIVDFNPRTALPRSGEIPFIDMAALPTSGRDIAEIAWRSVGSSGAKFKNGDTLVARITPCLENGKGAKIANLPQLGVGQGSTEFIVMRAKWAGDEDFVYYLSRHTAFRSFAIQQMVGTSGRQRVPWQSLVDFEIDDLDRAIRRSAGEVLSALDDKIELNRRMNETLEAMAQAIFRDWFVDFGPVRRKLEGTTDPVAIMGGLIPDPARAAELSGLFPDGFGEHELPVGWSEPPLSEHLEIIGGGTPKTSNPAYWGNDIPWFSVVDTPSRSDVFVFDTEKRITPAGLAGSSARLIPAGTTIISARGTVGNLAIAAQDMTFNQSCYALQSARGDHPYFVYLLAAHAVDQLRSMAHGSVFSTITRQTFDAMSFASPQIAVLDAIERQLSPLFKRIKAEVAENRTLAETRDYLLPRLMSGEVRVGELGAQTRSEIAA
jgi:type I restriction enzyme S subunit